MLKRCFGMFLIIVILFSCLTFTPKVSADFDCLTLTQNSTPDQKAFCTNELNQLNQELATLNSQLQAQQAQTGTLKGDVANLTGQINALKTKIKARGIAIAQLKADITNKVLTIETLSEKIDREHESLSQILRKTNENDNSSITHLILSDKTLSEFYADSNSFQSVNNSIKKSIDTIHGIKNQTEVQKKSLETQQNKELDAKAQLESATKQVAQNEADKKQLLNLSQKKEGDYKALAAEKKARADQIKARLFQLAGGTGAIKFEDALAYAQNAQAKTSIDPAFLLAILTQESGIGQNVGQCYLSDTKSGYGVNIKTGKSWSNLMAPNRDVPIFLNITSALGLDPLKTAVSCPIAGVKGYGGAMGPAQFIPSTWKSIDDRLQNLLGVPATNPWAASHAFMASAIYLTDLGAIGDSYSGQIRAACKYYGSGGSTCSYGRSVMGLKSRLQGDIDYLKQYGVSKR